jgi:hypothetical protein
MNITNRTGRQIAAAIACALSILGGPLLGAAPTAAHPGALNSEGCHTNRKTGDYHCHRATPASSPAGVPLGKPGVIKKSQNEICHAPGTTYYEQTVRFTSYQTTDECLASGGRLPKR